MDAEIGTYPLHLQFFLFFCLILYLFGMAEKNTIFFADSHWQIDINMTSHFMQLEKVGRGLLREAFWGEGECYVILNLPPLFKLTQHFPSPLKTSHSNPHPTFSNCTKRDVLSVSFFLTTFRKKTIVYYWLPCQFL